MGNNPNNYISLQEATKYCDHSQEYLSLRARQGKLKAVKFGRNWVTKKEWLEEYLGKVEEYNNNLKIKKIALPPKNLPVEKTPVLRFRFVTALVFVLLAASCVFGKTSFQNVFETANPYVVKISQATDFAAKEIIDEGYAFISTFASFGSSIFEDAKNSYAQIPPLVRPVKDFVVDTTTEISVSISNEVQEFNENFNFHFITLASEFNEGFNKGMAEIFKNVSSYTYIVGGAGDIIIENTIKVAVDTVSDIPQSLSRTELALVGGFATVSGNVSQIVGNVSLAAASIGDVFQEYGQWIGKIFGEIPRSLTRSYINTNDFLEKEITGDIDDLVRGISVIRGRASISWQEIVNGTIKGYVRTNDFLEEKISQGYKIVTQFWQAPEKIVEEELIPKHAEEGVVIIPSTEKNEEVKEKIKESFSDEVKVEPKDESSGIITPVFREGEGERYLYILVPIKN